MQSHVITTPISRLLLEMMKARDCPLFGGSYSPLHTSQLTPLMVVMANKLVEPTAGDENFILRILIKESEQMKGWIWILRNLQQFKGKFY